METKSEKNHTSEKSKPLPSVSQEEKTAYSCYFEVPLDKDNFGLKREKHNRICNEQLIEQIKLFESKGRQFYSNKTNIELIKAITAKMRESPKSFTWDHCSSSTTNGRCPPS